MTRLESFLVHYRNLIEFLGKQADRIRPGDIHITTIWKLEVQPPPAWVDDVHAKGKALWAKYEEQPDRISRYLQHCTTQRIDAKDWQIDEMVNEIEPLLSEVDMVIKPTNTLLEAIRPMFVLGPHSASTAVATATAVLPLISPDSTEPK